MATILLTGESAGKMGPIKVALATAGCTLVECIVSDFVRYGNERIDLVLADLSDSPNIQEPIRLVKQFTSWQHIPILAVVNEAQLVRFRNGVSDFVVTPYRDSELVTRVMRLLDKYGADKNDTLTFGDLAVNSANYDVFLAGRKLDLTYREYRLLNFLAAQPGRVVTREAILNEVWGYDCYVGDRTVDVHIRRLRSKLEQDGRSFIETVRNVGYRFRK